MHVEFLESDISSENPDEILGVKLCIYDSTKYDDNMESYRELVSYEEKCRADKFIYFADAKVFVLAHAKLRECLSKELGIPMKNITLGRNKYGKPFLTTSDFDFNLSHTKNYFAIIVAKQKGIKVGVDIEEYKTVSNLEGIIKNYMHPKEIEIIRQKPNAFFTFWTRKEALLKLLGLGLVNELHNIDTTNGKREVFIKEDLFYENSNSLIQTIHSDKFVLSYAVSRKV